MGKKLLVLHGPNLNLLGEADGAAGGGLEDLNRALREKAAKLGVELKVVQSNHEGVLLDALHAERKDLGGVAINPAGYFGSHALREALELIGAPAIEVTLGDPREDSVVAEACELQVGGDDGFEPYLDALERLAEGDFDVGAAEEEEEARPSRQEPEVKKSLGRRAEAPAQPLPAPKPEKPPERKSEAPARALARTVQAAAPAAQKTLGRARAEPAPAKAEKGGKTLGRVARGTPASDFLTRAMVREKIADRLAGRLTPAELASWARTQWLEVQRGAPAESGFRDLLEDSLQSLTLSTLPASKLSDEQLVDLMTQLEG
ncbi:type II 3-dehydroquinate dehydratase [Myxococcaceae bacterium GXIMD 01537]